MVPIICSTITVFLSCIEKVYQLTSTQQKAPENSEVHRSLHNCGSSIRNLLHVTALGPINWRRFLNFWKICGPWYKWYTKIHSLRRKECAPPPVWRPNTNVAEDSNRGLFGELHNTKVYCMEKWKFLYVVVGGTHNYHTTLKKIFVSTASIISEVRLYGLGSIRNKGRQLSSQTQVAPKHCATTFHIPLHTSVLHGLSYNLPLISSTWYTVHQD